MNFEIFLIFACAFVALAELEGEDCYTKKGCGMTPKKKPRYAEDYWIRVNKKANTCTVCLCGFIKKHTKSCIVIDTSSNSPHKKKGLLGRIYFDNTKILFARKFKNETVVIRDEEVELDKAQAEKIECDDEPEPVFDNRKKKYVFPPMKYVHYFYAIKQSYCCTKKSPVFTNIPSSCYQKFDSRCDARIVRRRDSSKFCETPNSSAKPAKIRDIPNKH